MPAFLWIGYQVNQVVDINLKFLIQSFIFYTFLSNKKMIFLICMYEEDGL